MLLLPLVELASVGVHRTRARRATAVSSSSRRAYTFSHLSRICFFSFVVTCSYLLESKLQQDFIRFFVQQPRLYASKRLDLCTRSIPLDSLFLPMNAL